MLAAAAGLCWCCSFCPIYSLPSGNNGDWSLRDCWSRPYWGWRCPHLSISTLFLEDRNITQRITALRGGGIVDIDDTGRLTLLSKSFAAVAQARLFAGQGTAASGEAFSPHNMLLGITVDNGIAAGCSLRAGSALWWRYRGDAPAVILFGASGSDDGKHPFLSQSDRQHSLSFLLDCLRDQPARRSVPAHPSSEVPAARFRVATALRAPAQPEGRRLKLAPRTAAYQSFHFMCGIAGFIDKSGALRADRQLGHCGPW